MKKIITSVILVSILATSLVARPAQARGRGLGLAILGAAIGVAAASSHHHRRDRWDREDRWESRHSRHRFGDVCQRCGFGLQPVVYQQPQVIYQQQPQVVYQQPQQVVYQQPVQAVPASFDGCEGVPQIIEERIQQPDGSVVIRTTRRTVRTIASY